MEFKPGSKTKAPKDESREISPAKKMGDVTGKEREY